MPTPAAPAKSSATRSRPPGRDRALATVRRCNRFRGRVSRLRRGCDKRLETCRTKFANAANHRGFPHMPGNGFWRPRAAPDERE
ncbi:MAG: phage BR0599 family protein [Hyphomicrobiaceae bacterium]